MADFGEILGKGFHRVITILGPITFTVPSQIERDGIVTEIRKDLGCRLPRVPGLASSVRE
jgi:hypothetical protein